MHKPVEKSGHDAPQAQSQRLPLSRFRVLDLTLARAGPSWARLIMYTGMRISSAEALRIGLVDRVIPTNELWGSTMEIATTISGNAPLAIKAAKITIAQVLKDPADRDMAAVKKIGLDCMDSEDFREGRRAFMEKRKPEFKGK